MDLVVATPAQRHQIVDVGGAALGPGSDVMGLAPNGVLPAASASAVAGDQRIHLSLAGPRQSGAPPKGQTLAASGYSATVRGMALERLSVYVEEAVAAEAAEAAERRGVSLSAWLNSAAERGLCELHSAQPLGLADYRSMFEQRGEVDLSAIEQLAQEASRLADLAKRLLDSVADLTRDLGPLTASQLRLTMDHQDREDLPTEAEIGEVLVSLSSPLVRALEGNPDHGYVLACSPAVTAERLRILGEALSAR